jgi:CHAT domain-containing protein
MNLYDLYDLTVHGELVVLSSCESGTADANGANEIVGLTRGLLYAGAPAVLTSQWAVDDAVAGDFMECFHAALRRGEGAAAALRRAMTLVRETHPHPYFWAPFFLTGCPADARRPAPSAQPAEIPKQRPGRDAGRRTSDAAA